MENKILIIEDDEFLADIYLTKFQEVGFVADVAQNGDEGIAKAKELQPTVILLDVVMPGKDGFEVLQELRKEGIPSHIILLTNLGEQENQEKGKQLGADAYLVKAHHTPTEVVAKVKEIIANGTKQ